MKKTIRNRIFKNTATYTISDILNKLVPFVLLPVLTRYLTPADYGIIAIFFVFTGILGVFMTLELNTAISVKFFKLSRNELKTYIANILLIVCIATSLVLFIFIISHSYFSRILLLPTEWIFIGVIVTLLQFFTTINLVLWQSEHKPISFGIYQIFQTILNLTLSLVLIIGFGMNWEGRLIAVSASSILFGFMSFSFLYNRNYIHLKYDKTYIKDGLKFGIPLLPHSLSTWVRTGIDRIFLTILIAPSATGLYTVGFQIASVILVLTSAINKAFAPTLFEQLKEITEIQKKTFVTYTYLCFAFLLTFAGFLSLAAPLIVDVVIGKDFQESQNYIGLLAFGFAFYGMSSILVNFILYSQKTIFLSYISIVVGILHVGLTYVLIIYNGAIGAAQAIIFTSFITFICVWRLSQKILPMPWFVLLKKI